MVRRRWGTAQLGTLECAAGHRVDGQRAVAGAGRLIAGLALVAGLLWTVPRGARAQPPATAPPAAGATWSSYHGSQANNALFVEPGRQPVVWRSAVVQDQFFAVSIVGDTVYAAGAGLTHAVYALDRLTGQIKWARIVNNIVMTQPIVAAGRVFIGTGNNYMRAVHVRDWTRVDRGTLANAVVALDAQTGVVAWRVRLRGEAMPTPTYIDGVLYVVTGDRHFLAIDAATGHLLWQLHLRSYMSMSSPVRDGNMLVFGGAHPYAEYGVDIVARRLVWEHRFRRYRGLPVTGAIDDCSGAVYQHRVYCTGTASRASVPAVGGEVQQFAWALDTRTGALVWQQDQGLGRLPSFFTAGVPAVQGGVDYLESPGSAGVEARDTATGRLLWHANLAATGRSAPIIDGPLLFIADDAGTVYELDTRTGHLLHTMHVGGGVSNVGLVLDSGTLYVPNALGGVVDAIPERLFTSASTRDVAPPYGPVTARAGASACG